MRTERALDLLQEDRAIDNSEEDIEEKKIVLLLVVWRRELPHLGT